MNTAALPTWLPARLAPVLTLSYPTARPPAPDAFPDSDFYHIGLLDGWMLLSMIALFAVARDALRIYVLEPLARRKLEYDFRRGYRMLGPDVPPAAKANGNGNGHHANGAANGGVPKGNKREKREINRRVLRIAEQGWQVVYYICQWSMGLVRSPASPDASPAHRP
jgi:acyl-CoA-dependent ceramide synthase